ncbi:type 1 fimbrial protein [Escherichia coli]|nr:type 1 fimbrial protein [Shigella flexneri]
MNKENRRVAWVWFALLLVAGGLYAADSSLDMNFKGTLVNNVCMFEHESSALEVTFPGMAVKYFEHNERTPTESFVIGLKNCSADTQGKMVDLMFAFPDTETIGGVAMLKPSGDTGVVIGLVDTAGNPVVPGKAVNVGTVGLTGDGSVNQYSLGAYVMVPAGRSVNAGQYSATTTFTVNYR